MSKNEVLRELSPVLREIVLHLATTETTKQQLLARVAELAGEPVDKQPAAAVDAREARIAELEAQLAAALDDGAPPADTKSTSSGRAKAGAAS